MSDLLCEILSICYKINQQTKAHCFFDYSGHVDNYMVQYFPNGWRENMPQEEYNESYVAYCQKVNTGNLANTKAKLLEIANELGVEL